MRRVIKPPSDTLLVCDLVADPNQSVFKFENGLKATVSIYKHYIGQFYELAFLTGALMDILFSLALQILYGIANLALISLGLAIVFGMMRVINLAHGEFPVGYTVVVATNNGVNLWFAMLVLAHL